MLFNEELHGLWLDICDRGHFAGLRITLSDPDSPFRRTRNVYEDLDQDTPSSVRQALIILFPEHAKSHAGAKGGDGQIVMSHADAIKDMVVMVDKFGYLVTSIEKDL